LKRFVPEELIVPILSKLQINSPPAAGNE
jgi:hypothetical protein